MTEQEKLQWQLKNGTAALISAIIRKETHDKLNEIIEMYKLVELLKKLQ